MVQKLSNIRTKSKNDCTDFMKIGSQSAYLVDPQIGQIWLCMGCRLNQIMPNPSVWTKPCLYANFDEKGEWPDGGREGIYWPSVKKWSLEALHV